MLQRTAILSISEKRRQTSKTLGTHNAYPHLSLFESSLYPTFETRTTGHSKNANTHNTELARAHPKLSKLSKWYRSLSNHIRASLSEPETVFLSGQLQWVLVSDRKLVPQLFRMLGSSLSAQVLGRQ